MSTGESEIRVISNTIANSTNLGVKISDLLAALLEQDSTELQKHIASGGKIEQINVSTRLAAEFEATCERAGVPMGRCGLNPKQPYVTTFQVRDMDLDTVTKIRDEIDRAFEEEMKFEDQQTADIMFDNIQTTDIRRLNLGQKEIIEEELRQARIHYQEKKYEKVEKDGKIQTYYALEVATVDVKRDPDHPEKMSRVERALMDSAIKMSIGEYQDALAKDVSRKMRIEQSLQLATLGKQHLNGPQVIYDASNPDSYMRIDNDEVTLHVFVQDGEDNVRLVDDVIHVHGYTNAERKQQIANLKQEYISHMTEQAICNASDFENEKVNLTARKESESRVYLRQCIDKACDKIENEKLAEVQITLGDTKDWQAKEIKIPNMDEVREILAQCVNSSREHKKEQGLPVTDLTITEAQNLQEELNRQLDLLKLSPSKEHIPVPELTEDELLANEAIKVIIEGINDEFEEVHKEKEEYKELLDSATFAGSPQYSIVGEVESKIKKNEKKEQELLKAVQEAASNMTEPRETEASRAYRQEHDPEINEVTLEDLGVEDFETYDAFGFEQDDDEDDFVIGADRGSWD